jgi:acyl carrier protein
MTLEEFKVFVIETLNLEHVSPDMIVDDQPLFGEGLGLDSVDALELVVGLEKRYGVQIRSQEIDPAAFASASAFFDYVQGQIAGRSGAAG